MTRIIIVIVGFLFYVAVARGRNILFEGKLNSWKTFLKKQGVHFYRNGSPFDLKILNFWPMLHPRSSLLRGHCEDWIHWVSPFGGAMAPFCLETCPIFSPPRSPQILAFCPIR